MKISALGTPTCPGLNVVETGDPDTSECKVSEPTKRMVAKSPRHILQMVTTMVTHPNDHTHDPPTPVIKSIYIYQHITNFGHYFGAYTAHFGAPVLPHLHWCRRGEGEGGGCNCCLRGQHFICQEEEGPKAILDLGLVI